MGSRNVQLYRKINENIVIDKENNLIYGLQPFTDADIFEYFAFNTEGCDFVVENSEAKLGTGVKVDVVKWSDSSTAESYTAVLFGDVDGNEIYDGQDATIVNCIANGLLSREQVGEAKYTAADCNHDGSVDSNDVLILEQAGLLLVNVDQSKDDCFETDAYAEYLDLIDQNPTVDETLEVPTEQTETEGKQQTIIEMIIEFVKMIIDFIRSFAVKI